MINEDKVVKFQLAQKIYFLVTLITLGVVVAFLLLLNATGADWLVDLPFDIAYVVIFFNVGEFGTLSIWNLSVD